MDPEKVAMLVMSSGLRPLPDHLEKLVQDEDWWEQLEATPEDQLTPEQREVIAAILGADGQL